MLVDGRWSCWGVCWYWEVIGPDHNRTSEIISEYSLTNSAQAFPHEILSSDEWPDNGAGAGEHYRKLKVERLTCRKLKVERVTSNEGGLPQPPPLYIYYYPSLTPPPLFSYPISISHLTFSANANCKSALGLEGALQPAWSRLRPDSTHPAALYMVPLCAAVSW